MNKRKTCKEMTTISCGNVGRRYIFTFHSLHKPGLSSVDGKALGPANAAELGTDPGSATY